MIFELLVTFNREGSTIKGDFFDGVSSYVCFGSDFTLDTGDFELVLFYHQLDKYFYDILKHSDTIFIDDTDILLETNPQGFNTLLQHLEYFCKDKNIFFVTKNFTGKNFIRNRTLFSKSTDRLTINKDGTTKSIKH